MSVDEEKWCLMVYLVRKYDIKPDDCVLVQMASTSHVLWNNGTAGGGFLTGGNRVYFDVCFGYSMEKMCYGPPR